MDESNLIPPLHGRFDQNDPEALIHMFYPQIQKKILASVFKRPDLFHMDEGELKRILRSEGATPNPVDNVIRMKFWTAFEECVASGRRKIELKPLSIGVCDYEFFVDKYLVTTPRVAWMLCPPINYSVKIGEALAFNLDELRDVLDLPHKDPETGKINTSLINLKIKIFSMLDQRLNGAPTQRLEQKSLMINVTSSDHNKIKALVEEDQTTFLERRIRDLEQRERRALHVPEPLAMAEWQTMPVTGKDAAKQLDLSMKEKADGEKDK